MEVAVKSAVLFGFFDNWVLIGAGLDKGGGCWRAPAKRVLDGGFLVVSPMR